MVALETLAYIITAYSLLLSVTFLLLAVDLGPDAAVVGGLGLVFTATLGIGIYLVFGLPTQIHLLRFWFAGGVVSIILLVVFLYSLRWMLHR